MKNFLFILLISTNLIFAQNGFELGNEYYKKQQYQQAIESYESVLNVDKKQSPELYFNLANSYFKLNKVAPAIYNYEKALLLNPNDEEIQNNLRFAQKRTIDEIKVQPQLGFKKAIRNITEKLNYNTWAKIAVSFSVLFLLFFLGYYFSYESNKKRLFFLGMIALLLLILTIVFIAFFNKNNYDNEKTAIVFVENVSLKSEPQESSEVVFTLHEGTKVMILEILDNWEKVQLTDGTEGWLEKDVVKEIK